MTVTAGIYTLGCKVNQYESEAIAESLEAAGFTLCEPSRRCDLYIINTCTVTAESDRKARQFIRRALTQNPEAYILVTGCLAQADAEQIAAIAGVDFICGNREKLAIVRAATALAAQGYKNDRPTVAVSPLDGAPFEDMQITRFARTRAYVKIEDGCESRCTYCIIPTARGNIRSKPAADVIAEVRALANAGCREVVLTGIEVSAYGRDLGGYNLADLLCALDAETGIGRIRLGSLDPSLLREEFVSRVAPLRSLAPHFHLSLQSGSDHILHLMRRPYSSEQARAAVNRLRAALPHAEFTADIIVGFPGETDEDFAESAAFLREARFLDAHIFAYSRRPGTPAAEMPEQIDEAIKHARSAALMAEQAALHTRRLENVLGEERILPVLFETIHSGVAQGHSPEFFEVCVKTDRDLRGLELPVRPTAHDGVRLLGELCAK